MNGNRFSESIGVPAGLPRLGRAAARNVAAVALWHRRRGT